MPYSSLAPSFLSYFHPTYFISIMAHVYSLFDLYIPYGNFNFILVLVLQFPDSLNLSFHNLSIHQFSRKDLSLAQFIPRIYNKIIIKILGYFWGVTQEEIEVQGAQEAMWDLAQSQSQLQGLHDHPQKQTPSLPKNQH